MSIAVKMRNYYNKSVTDEAIESILTSNWLMKNKIYRSISDKKSVIICSSSDVDALISGPFAMYIENKTEGMKCPVILTKNGATSLGQETYKCLNSWATNEDDLFDIIYIIGGVVAIPDRCIGDSAKYTKTENSDKTIATYTRKSGYSYSNFSQGEALKYTKKVIRICGQDRYRTSFVVANQISNPTYLFFSNGMEYIDAYSIATAACYLRCPLIFLPQNYTYQADPSDLVAKGLNEYLDKVKGSVKKVFIAGGGQRNLIEVEEAVRKRLGLTMPNSVERIAGKNRYQTSYSIAKEFKDFLDNVHEDPYPRDQLNNKENLCSRLIMVGGDNNSNDCPVAPILAVKYKCPLIVDNFQVKVKVTKGFINDNKLYRTRTGSSGSYIYSDEITITDLMKKGIFRNSGDGKYYIYSGKKFLLRDALHPSREPQVTYGYKNGNNFYKTRTGNDTTSDPYQYLDQIEPYNLDVYIDIPKDNPYQYKNDTYNTLDIETLDTIGGARTYNIMSYLQIKRPQWVYCFTNYSIDNNINSVSGQHFQNQAKFYNGTIYNTGNEYDISRKKISQVDEA